MNYASGILGTIVFGCLLSGCGGKSENVLEVALPFKESGVTLTDTITREMQFGELTLRIDCGERGSKKLSDWIPFIYSLNDRDELLDSMKLFEDRPYVGTDSDYTPWIEIDQSGIITRTDTFSYYNEAKDPRTDDSIRLVLMPPLPNDKAIIVEKFKVDKKGRFSKTN